MPLLPKPAQLPIHIPAIRFEAVGDSPHIARSFAEIDSFDWIVFTSANGVRFFREHCNTWPRARIAAVGPATAAALREAGIDVDFVPDELSARLAPTLGDVAGRRICSRERKRPMRISWTAASPWSHVDDVPIYRTHSARVSDLHAIDLGKGVDCILFASGSAVRSIADAAAEHDQPLQSNPVVCIGPVTADTARSLGLNVVAVAESHTTAGLIDALTDYFRRKESHS